MKIALITDTYYPQLNGVVVSVDNLSRGLRDLGHDVHVIAPSVKGYKDTDEDVQRIASVKIPFLVEEARIPIVTPHNIWHLLTLDVEIIHAHGNGFFTFLAYFIAKIRGIPYVLTFHTAWDEYTHYVLGGKLLTPGMVRSLMKFTANLYDGIIVPSEKMKKELMSYGIKTKITVLSNSIDLRKFQGGKKGFLHTLLNLDVRAQIVLSVGRLGKEKNFAFLLKMFQSIVAHSPHTYLVILGKGPEKEHLMQLALTYGIQDNVFFPGTFPQDKMKHIYKDACVFVFASLTETQGMCLMEAAACGVPLVVVSDEAFTTIAQDGVNGFVVPLDIDRFAQKVEILLQDKKKASTFGKNGQEIIQQHFSEGALMQQFVSYYKSFLKTATD